MQKNIGIKTLILSAILISLTACGESNDLDEPTNGNGTNTNSPETGGSTTNTGGTDGTGSPTNTGGTDGTGNPTNTDGTGNPTTGNVSALNSNIPLFITSACDALPASDAVQSNTVAAPTAITTGQIVTGRIDPDSATNTEHFWSIDLQPGFYHVVLESSRIDDRSSNLGIELTDLVGFETADDLRIIRANEVGYRARNHAFIEIAQARTLILRAEPVHSAEDYSFAIFENGSAVPSPFFSNCPDITPISLGTTQALVLPESNSIADEQWYQIDLEAIDHVLQSTAARVDGADRNIIYKFTYVDQFGQNSRIEDIGTVNEVGVTANGSGALNRTEPGNVWIRLVNRNAELTMEFTLNPGS